MYLTKAVYSISNERLEYKRGRKKINSLDEELIDILFYVKEKYIDDHLELFSSSSELDYYYDEEEEDNDE